MKEYSPWPKINRTASAHWTGGLKDGKGAISLEIGAMKDYPYGFAARFEGQKGTNPEELLGAAHAGCFTMALSLILGEAKLTATEMNTTAKVTLEQVEGGFAITAVAPDAPRQDPRHRPEDLRGAGQQGQGRLPDLQGAEGRDHARREAGIALSNHCLSSRGRRPRDPYSYEWIPRFARDDREIAAAEARSEG